ncbi:hypothetical protein AWW66_03515 [Micromonospora rosaria]|uniref:Uncharacterized protein n=1 Tax=Micromonospora rosaria TaxID=47874 RepID=A0A136PY80_9ACTN|nr:hypothetical protein [Micromonospora rosaria]KXK63395.1 hypothetical protein AWW66_03515 [Micromonospora rosaria]
MSADERAALIAGLRELADALEANPALPLPRAEISRSVLLDNDAAGQAEVARAAELLGTEVVSDNGSAHTQRAFGGLTYEVFYVSRQRMTDHEALMSYRGAVDPAPVGA